MLVDPRHPFFRRLWVLVLCVLLPLAWAGVELAAGSPLWALLFAAAGLYLAVTLLVPRR
ncbi:hypothetical protein [Paracoccus aminovorans]|uniref:hypothetical protein n=1 Tax=Paracoccus aminovorans TaxID=34004 RepID=UPI002B25AC63|nr:hypothetical protein [Paracoccus aminovorans]